MKTKHLNDETLTGYVYSTLDDAARETLNAHLQTCASCRERLSEHERFQRSISNAVRAAVNQAVPSERMTYAAISGSKAVRSPARKLWRNVAVSTPVALAATGLFLTVLGFWQMGGLRSLFAPGQQPGAFPTLACFLFMLTSMGEFDKAFTIRPRIIALTLVAATLWLGSAFIGLLNIIVIRDLAIMAVVAAGGRATEAGPAAILAVLVAASLYVGFVIGGAEYHIKNIGQPGSWKLFSLTLLGQLFILILPYLVP